MILKKLQSSKTVPSLELLSGINDLRQNYIPNVSQIVGILGYKSKINDLGVFYFTNISFSPTSAKD